MPSAADIITYIGVPLTVAGVIPLLWNMFKAFWIRYKLSQSLPADLRPYYTLIADPAAGTVSVVAPRFRTVDGFWRLLQTPPEHSRVWRSRRWLHIVVYRGVPYWATGMFRSLAFLVRHLSSTTQQKVNQFAQDVELHAHTLPAEKVLKDEATTLRLDGQAFYARRRNLLHSPWMTAALQIGFAVVPVQSSDDRTTTDDEQDEETTYQRFSVDIDLRTQSPALVMQWEEFIFFAAGLEGLYPLKLAGFRDTTRLGNECVLPQLKAVEVKPRWENEGKRWAVTLSRQRPQTFSAQKAFAAFGVMLFERGGQLYCQRVTAESAYPLDTIDDKHAGEIFGLHDPSMDEEYSPHKSVAVALRWVLFTQAAGIDFHGGWGKIPVSPALFAARVNSLYALRKAHIDGLLEGFLHRLDGGFLRRGERYKWISNPHPNVVDWLDVLTEQWHARMFESIDELEEKLTFIHKKMSDLARIKDPKGDILLRRWGSTHPVAVYFLDLFNDLISSLESCSNHVYEGIEAGAGGSPEFHYLVCRELSTALSNHRLYAGLCSSYLPCSSATEANIDLVRPRSDVELMAHLIIAVQSNEDELLNQGRHVEQDYTELARDPSVFTDRDAPIPLAPEEGRAAVDSRAVVARVKEARKLFWKIRFKMRTGTPADAARFLRREAGEIVEILTDALDCLQRRPLWGSTVFLRSTRAKGHPRGARNFTKGISDRPAWKVYMD